MTAYDFIPATLTKALREAKVSADELTQLVEGLYFCDGPVRLHVDGDFVEAAAYVVILMNDLGLQIAQGDRISDAPVGSIHRIVKHEHHGALLPAGFERTHGRFAFLALDVLKEDGRYDYWPNLPEFVFDVLQEINNELKAR